MDDGDEKQKIHPRLITILMIIEGMTMSNEMERKVETLRQFT